MFGMVVVKLAHRVSIYDPYGHDLKIDFDLIMSVKRELGMGEQTWVEVYPPESQLINNASQRHFFYAPNSVAERGAKHLDRTTAGGEKSANK